jgi:hypothetical protein
MPDFSTWERKNLESFANEAYEAWVKLKEENEELRLNNEVLLKAWRKEVVNGQT